MGWGVTGKSHGNWRAPGPDAPHRGQVAVTEGLSQTELMGAGGAPQLEGGGGVALSDPNTFLCRLLPTQFVENVTRTGQDSVTTTPTPTWLRRRVRTRKTRSHPPRFPRGRRSRSVS